MTESAGKHAISRRLLIGAGTNWLAFAATLLVGFFLTPYLVSKLGDGQYGVWAFVESLLAYFTLFDLGIAACVVRFVARFHATGDREELNRLVSTALALFLGLGTLLFATGMLLLPVVLPSMQESGMPAGEVLGFSLLMLGNLAIALPFSVFPSILDGLEQFALKSGIRIVVLAIRTIGTILLLEQSPSLWNLGLLFTACNLFEHLAFALAGFRSLPSLRFGRRYVDRTTLHRVKGYSLHAFIAMVAGRTCVQSGTIIVGAFLGASPVTYFAIASRFVEFAKALLRTATNTLTPAVSAREAAGDIDSIREMFLRGTRWALYAMLPVQIGLIIFGRSFLVVWLGDPLYAERCYPTLVILSSTLSLVIAQSIASRILYGTGRLRTFARAAVLEAIANVALSLLLCPRFGLIGVAIGVAVPNFIMCLWVIGHTANTLQISVRRYFTESWFKPIVAAVIPTTMWLFISLPLQNWTTLTTSIGVGLMSYAVVVFVIEGSLRFAVSRRIRNWRRMRLPRSIP